MFVPGYFSHLQSCVRRVVLDSSPVVAGGRPVSPHWAGDGGEGAISSGERKLGRCSMAADSREGNRVVRDFAS